MEVLLADEFGFCFGVERAVEMVEDALEVGAPVRTLGPLIHNTQEMKRLEGEDAAIVVHDDQFEVIGEGIVAIFDGKTRSKKKLLTVSPGQTFDLKKRTTIE